MVTNKRGTYKIKIKDGKVLDSCRTKARALKLKREQEIMQGRCDIEIVKEKDEREKDIIEIKKIFTEGKW